MGLDAAVYRHSITSDDEQQVLVVKRRLGNVAMIASLSEEIKCWVKENLAPLICSRILYSGSHSGDTIEIQEIDQLREEIKVIKCRRDVRHSAELEEFLGKLEELALSAEKEKSPIIFI